MPGDALEGLLKRLPGLVVAAESHVDQLAHGIPGPDVARVEAGRIQEHLQPAQMLAGTQVNGRQDPGRRRVGPDLPGSFQTAPRRTDLLELGLGQPPDGQGLRLIGAPVPDPRDRADRTPILAARQMTTAQRQGIGFRAMPGPEAPGSPVAELAIGGEPARDGSPQADHQSRPTPGRPGEPPRHEHLAQCTAAGPISPVLSSRVKSRAIMPGIGRSQRAQRTSGTALTTVPLAAEDPAGGRFNTGRRR
jgi:hypothetical protein